VADLSGIDDPHGMITPLGGGAPFCAGRPG
jgi:hypothetical protein